MEKLWFYLLNTAISKFQCDPNNCQFTESWKSFLLIYLEQRVYLVCAQHKILITNIYIYMVLRKII